MSIHAVERALYETSYNPEAIQRYMADPEGYLARYKLTDEECRQIIDCDVKALGDKGASHMLLMMFWVGTHEGGLASMPEYVRRLNT
jgi:hypothetical protein